MNRAEFYKRVVGVIAPERLQSRRVVVVGVGSGGSRVAAELARRDRLGRSGLGELVHEPRMAVPPPLGALRIHPGPGIPAPPGLSGDEGRRNAGYLV